MQATLEDLSVDRLASIARSSMEGWRCFLESGRRSPLYQRSRGWIGGQRAARITLLGLYLETLSAQERNRLEEDAEGFLNAAYGFVREMVTPRPKNEANRRYARIVFCEAMRALLREQANPPAREEAATFLRAMLELCSDAAAIVAAWDDLREFRYRTPGAPPVITG